MTIAIEDATAVNGINLVELARDLAWSVDFELIEATRPFGPESVPVNVQEIHANGTMWGFLVAHGLPGKNLYAAVSEVPGDERWHYAVPEFEGTDDEMDAAGRAVIADHLVRDRMRKMGNEAA